MPTILDSVRVSSPVGNGYLIRASDFGVIAPGGNSTVTDGGWSASNLTASTTGGSLPTSTGAFKISYITAQGESLASAEATVSVTGATGRVTVTIPALPSATANSPEKLAAPVIGWRIYSGNGSGNALLNAAANSTVEVQQNFVTTNSGTIAGFPVAQTTVQVIIYGLGAAVPTVNLSGIQQPMPVIGANNSSDVFWLVSRTWTPYKMVSWIRPTSSADAGGLMPSLMDCVAPLWAGSTAFSAAAFILVNNAVFMCTTAGTTASSIPAGLTTRPAKGSTVTDGTAVWTSFGERDLVRVRFSNTTGSSGQPISQEYDLLQE